MRRLAIILLSFFVLAQAASAAVDVHVFYGEGCPHCAAALDYLQGLDDPALNIWTHEVYFDQQNRELLGRLAQARGVELQGVPMLFVGEEVFTGFGAQTRQELHKAIVACEQEGCEDPLLSVERQAPPLQRITVPAVMAAAAVDAINPCAFAVLIILMTTILASRRRGRALLAGLSFSLAVFISYFLMGIGLYSAIGAAGIGRTFFVVVAILAIIIGLFNLKDYLWYGRWFVMEVPPSWRPRLKSLLRGVTSVPGAFAVGFVVSLFLLPCTSGPYIVILGLLSQTATAQRAVLLLLLYNLIFVLPMVLLTLAIRFGITSTEAAEKWRQGRLRSLHLVAGIILLLLGVGMFFALILGLI